MKQRLNTYTRYAGLALVILLILSSVIAGIFKEIHKDEPVQYGVTFSEKYARELGLDPEEAYESIIEELSFDRLRLMSYWDLREPAEGVYDFELLDWMMDTAAENNRRVTLALGLRQPRWPECHIPVWAQERNDDERGAALLEYIETVVRRYKNHPALMSYQLENEAANRSFGDCPPLDRNLLISEYQLVSQLDKKHPVIINVSNQSGIPLRTPRTEVVGFSLYEHAHFSVFEGGRQIRWNFFVSPSWHGLRAAVTEILYADRTFIHELQAEPWGEKATVSLSNERQLELMNAEKLHDQVTFAKKTGMREMYLWGAEWWYWRAVEFNDESLMQAAQSIFIDESVH